MYTKLFYIVKKPIMYFVLLLIYGFFFHFQNAASRKDKFTGYRLMTSVSIPVFDKNNHTVSTFIHYIFLKYILLLLPQCFTESKALCYYYIYILFYILYYISTKIYSNFNVLFYNNCIVLFIKDDLILSKISQG